MTASCGRASAREVIIDLAMKSLDTARHEVGSSSVQRLFKIRHLWRSEEHTSELQSLTNLVCRLLLEKKNAQTNALPPSAEPREHGGLDAFHRPFSLQIA